MYGRAVGMGRAWRLSVLLLHAGLLLILGGAVLTYFTAESGYIHLRAGDGFAATWRAEDAAVCPLPFKVRLDTLSQGRGGVLGQMTMFSGGVARASGFGPGCNACCDGYRFILRSLDADGGGAVFSVTADVQGQPVVYFGYALLFLGLLGCLLLRYRRRRGRGDGAGDSSGSSVRRSLVCVAVVAEVAVLCCIVVRGIRLGAFPAADYRDTFMLCGAISFAVALLCVGRVDAVSRVAMLAGGLSVAPAVFMPASSPVLAPVLDSPLLGIHVGLVMAAYVLFAVAALAAAMMLAGRGCVGITDAGLHTLLLAGVAVLAGGVAIGSVWAAGAWGRYWSWDPKETWALVTVLVYALPLHRPRIGALRRSRTFRLYVSLAFVTVLFTWFGVPYLFPGLHSYV